MIKHMLTWAHNPAAITRYEVKRLSNLLAQWKVKENGKE